MRWDSDWVDETRIFTDFFWMMPKVWAFMDFDGQVIFLLLVDEPTVDNEA